MGACSIDCFDRDRGTAEEQQEMIDRVPEALAYFLGLGPGARTDDGR
ncbi:hypothetical protein [Kitasatospora sp. NPDC001547]